MSDSNLPNTAAHGSQAALPEKPSSGGKGKALLGGLLVLALAGGTTAYVKSRGNDEPAAAQEETVAVRIGTTEASSPYWIPLKEKARAAGITLDVVSFTDYTQANPALAQKQIDLNLFQHLQFLAQSNAETKQDLAPVGSTYIVPLGLYSKKHTALNQIPKGGKIAIPNDPTNQARALLVLQQAGLLKLKGGGNTLSTPADVVKATSKVSVTPVDAAQTLAALPSVDGSVVNNNFALTGKLDPSKALFKDDPNKPAAKPYINVIVSRAAERNNATYKKVVELFHDPAVEKSIKDESKNTTVLVNRPQAELQTILDGLEKNQKK